MIERIKRILEELKGYTYCEEMKIDHYKMKACGYGEIDLLKEDSTNWEDFGYGDRWGGKDRHLWFKTKVTIPDCYKGKTIIYKISTGREGEWDAVNPQMLIHINGKPVQGIDVNHTEVLLSVAAQAGETYDIALFAHSGMKADYVYLKSSIAILNKETENLFYNLKVPLEIAELLEEGDKRRLDILEYMTSAVNMLDLRKPHSDLYEASVKTSNDFLEKEFYEKYCGSSDVIEMCVGHTHIDIAWLWTIAQTREKVIRSFSTVLQLMKQYPEYIFMSSQPQLYKFVKEQYPDLYRDIKEMVKAGRWEVEGAMWLEADCNLVSGESLVRQIIFGKRFIKEEFGGDSKILWLPDVFGYSAALPQILNKSGVKYFMTTKIGWNEYNRMPVDTFMWKGLDGTEILTHFITTADYSKEHKLSNNTTYNGYINASRVMGCWQRYQNKEINHEVLNCFGHGDGGGGPTKEMLESARRFEKGIPGSPVVKMGKALDYFEKLDETVKNNKKLPKWDGELYLEYHRGTYTSMARNKKANRRSEFLNLDTEFLSTLNSVMNNGKYPAGVLNSCWETTLLNQFHDIIPGSSIEEVYRDSKEDYDRISSLANEQLVIAIDNISGNLELKEISVVVFNQLSFIRKDIVTFELPEGWNNAQVFDGDKELKTQLTEENKMIFFGEGIPAKGYKAFTLRQKEQSCENTIEIDQKSFNNKYFDIKFDEWGNISSIYDKFNERQVLKEQQCGNLLQAFEDKPHNFDAWDINLYYQDKVWELKNYESIEVAEEGPVRACLKIVRKFLDSTIVQKIYIYNDIPKIDFSTWIDWKEKQILLKAAFPVEVHTNKATYEIQYGNVERPTHWNTSWDYAKFEVCGHKWADLSEGDYGVAILNDCKYGHDIKDSVMRLTLLKSAVEPNINADREIHEFTYSIYPHKGDFKNGRVIEQAYNLNCPLYAKVEEAHNGRLKEKMSFVSIDKENVIIEVVKKAEASEHTIVRMYECFNNRTNVVCTFAKTIASVEECDLLENRIHTLEPIENSFEFKIKPYEIKTFKVMFNQ